MHQNAPQPTPPTNPPDGGQLALQQQLDDVWRQMNQPKTTARQMTALYRRAAELRAELNTLENTPNGN